MYYVDDLAGQSDRTFPLQAAGRRLGAPPVTADTKTRERRDFWLFTSAMRQRAGPSLSEQLPSSSWRHLGHDVELLFVHRCARVNHRPVFSFRSSIMCYGSNDDAVGFY